MPNDDSNNAAPPPVTNEFAIARLAQAHPHATGQQLGIVASALRGEGAYASAATFEGAVTTRAAEFLAAMGAGRGAPPRTPAGQFAP